MWRDKDWDERRVLIHEIDGSQTRRKEGAWSVGGLPCALDSGLSQFCGRGGVDNREVPVHSILIEDGRTFFFFPPDLDPLSRPPSTERHETAASSRTLPSESERALVNCARRRPGGGQGHYRTPGTEV
jgi:hypothetical protein